MLPPKDIAGLFIRSPKISQCRILFLRRGGQRSVCSHDHGQGPGTERTAVFHQHGDWIFGMDHEPGIHGRLFAPVRQFHPEQSRQQDRSPDEQNRRGSPRDSPRRPGQLLPDRQTGMDGDEAVLGQPHDAGIPRHGIADGPGPTDERDGETPQARQAPAAVPRTPAGQVEDLAEETLPGPARCVRVGLFRLRSLPGFPPLSLRRAGTAQETRPGRL
mmetsp:Transcript_18023/g.50033  ORF Transcript_18023/g.50033 Transcript_18023/m.50033 type:complete len:216 (-) Transcript_18023:1482-2129(-)